MASSACPRRITFGQKSTTDHQRGSRGGNGGQPNELRTRADATFWGGLVSRQCPVSWIIGDFLLFVILWMWLGNFCWGRLCWDCSLLAFCGKFIVIGSSDVLWICRLTDYSWCFYYLCFIFNRVVLWNVNILNWEYHSISIHYFYTTLWLPTEKSRDLICILTGIVVVFSCLDCLCCIILCIISLGD